MAWITLLGTCVPPGPSKKTAGRSFTVWARAGNWARTQPRSRVDMGTPLCIDANYQLIERQPWAALWVAGGVAERNKGVGNECFGQPKGGSNSRRAEERCAHPACVQASAVGHQQHILNGAAEALH